MDPSANLKEQIEIAEQMFVLDEKGESLDEDDAFRLAELVLALDEWIRKAGHLPAIWEANRPKGIT